MGTERRRVLGTCPDCGTPIPDENSLIEYERLDGRVAVYAGCPECGIPVHPRSVE